MSFTIVWSKKTLFQDIKTTSSKNRKIDIFPKGLTHGFAPKWPFFQLFFFQAIQARKMLFTIIQSEKTPFYAIKTRSSKSRKIGIFPKGLIHGFGPKMTIFPSFLFKEMQATKMSFTIFQSKKTPLQAIKTRSPKQSKNWHFSKGVNPWFWSKNCGFSQFFFRQYRPRKCVLRYS